MNDKSRLTRITLIVGGKEDSVDPGKHSCNSRNTFVVDFFASKVNLTLNSSQTMSISQRVSQVKEKICLDPKTAAVFKRKKYLVQDKLAEGAFGKVYKVIKTDDGSFAAVKVMDTDKMSDIVLKVLVPRELELMTKIRHPHVLNVFDIFKSNRKYYIFMEFASGGSLDKKCNPYPPPVKSTKKWFRQTAQALTYIHDELTVCHRDIKLENVLLDSEGNAKLSDFGFSRIHEGGLARTVLGTPPYYSPQLIEGNE